MISKLTKEELEALIGTKVDKLLKDVYSPGPLLKGLNMHFEIMDEGIDSSVLHIWDYAWIVVKVKDIFIKVTGRLENDGDSIKCNHIDWEEVKPVPSVKYIPLSHGQREIDL